MFPSERLVWGGAKLHTEAWTHTVTKSSAMVQRGMVVVKPYTPAQESLPSEPVYYGMPADCEQVPQAETKNCTRDKIWTEACKVRPADAFGPKCDVFFKKPMFIWLKFIKYDLLEISST